MPHMPLQLRPDVRHACPACQTGRPSPFCQTCEGHGDVSEAQLAAWQRSVLAAAANTTPLPANPNARRWADEDHVCSPSCDH